MGLISLLFSNPAAFLILAIPLLYSIIFHEVAHGVVASWFGDDTAKYSGRLTLDPRPHIDPIGLIMLFIAGFGWARPVPVNFQNLKNFRVGLVCVALAGVVANILIASIALFILYLPNITVHPVMESILFVIVRINIMLGAFNLIPIPPLDGSKVLMGFLPPRMQYQLAMIEPYGFFILVGLLMTGILDPVIRVIQGNILLLITTVLKLFS